MPLPPLISVRDPNGPPILNAFLATRTPDEVLGHCTRCRRWRRVPVGATHCPICLPRPGGGREGA